MNLDENLQSVKSFPSYRVSSTGRVFNKENHELKQTVNRNGYAMVVLYNNGRPKNRQVHRVVAETFIPNPENKYTVNHKDGNKLNNDVSNLEWCTISENEKHAYDHGLKRSYLTYEDRVNGAHISGEKSKRPVRVMETGDVYPSGLECAEALGCDRGAISRCCNGTANKHHGYHFEFAD